MSLVYLVIAMAYGSIAFLLWWQAVPTLIARRGRYQALGVWLLGMAMAVMITGRINLASIGMAFSWPIVAHDLCLIALGLIELHRAKMMGGHRWTRCPEAGV